MKKHRQGPSLFIYKSFRGWRLPIGIHRDWVFINSEEAVLKMVDNYDEA